MTDAIDFDSLSEATKKAFALASVLTETELDLNSEFVYYKGKEGAQLLNGWDSVSPELQEEDRSASGPAPVEKEQKGGVQHKEAGTEANGPANKVVKKQDKNKEKKQDNPHGAMKGSKPAEPAPSKPDPKPAATPATTPPSATMSGNRELTAPASSASSNGTAGTAYGTAAAPPAPPAAAPVNGPAANGSSNGPSVDDNFARGGWAPRIPRRLTPMYYKIMVVGESGLGKTTFVRNLFEPYFKDGFQPAQDGTGTPLDLFEEDPERLCTELPGLPLVEASRMLYIKVQDTPGYGDDMNIAKHLHLIVQYLLSQRAKDYEHFSGNPRVGIEGGLPHSVSICLYFLPPHRMKTIDLIFLATLSQLVAVVPIIAKADSMTGPELKQYREHILRVIQDPSGFFKNAVDSTNLSIPLFRFSEADLDALGVDAGNRAPLFSAISSEEVDRRGGEYLPYRHYGWGTCYAMDRSHADTILLKRLLLGDCTESIWDVLDDSLKRYVDFCRKYCASEEKLHVVVNEACKMCEAYLNLDDTVQQRRKMKSLESEVTVARRENEELRAALDEAQRHVRYLDDQLSLARQQIAGLRAAQTMLKG